VDSVERAGGEAVDRFRAMAHAYVDFARDEPGLYRMLFDVPGELHPEWDADALPGAKSLALIQDAVERLRADASGKCVRSGPAADVFTVTVVVWTHLHGIASLLINRPTFPWPAVDQLLEPVIQSARTA